MSTEEERLRAEQEEDEFLAKFKRSPNDPRPEWAFKGDNILREMDEVPLFMTDLPDNLEEIPALAALQSLIYEGSPVEVARNFKDQGNEAYKSGPNGYDDAIKYYTQGLDQKCTDAGLNALLHLNRAAVQISRKNYGKALEDSREAMKLAPEDQVIQSKAGLRAAKAAFGLERFEEALSLAHGINTDDAKLAGECKALIQSIEEAISAAEKKQQELAQRSKLDRKIDAMLRSRGISRQPGCESAVLALLGPLSAPDALPRVTLVPRSASQLQWPVMLFYPPYGQSDCIQAWHEHTTFADTLGMVLEERPAWDTDGLYVPGKPLAVYWVDECEAVYRVEVKARLMDLFGRLVKRVDRGILGFFVLPAGTSAEATFLSRFPSPPTPWKP